MASTGDIAKSVLQLLLQAGVSGASSNPLYKLAMSGVNVSDLAANTSRSNGTEAFLAKQYPDEFAPSVNHSYTVLPGAAPYTNMKSGDIEATRMQEIGEHNKAITKFLRPNMTPKEQRKALLDGLEYEKSLAPFWNESETRKGHTYKASSTAVSGIRLTPDGRVEIAWKTNPNKYYTYKQYPNTYEASLAAQKLLKEDSIGTAVMPFQRDGKMLHFKKARDYGSWSRPNYDPAFA